MCLAQLLHFQKFCRNNHQQLKRFMFNGLSTYAKITDIYDGDTVTIVFNYQNKVYKHQFRMFGYDSPEIKVSKNDPNRVLHKHAAELVKEYLWEKLLTENNKCDLGSTQPIYGKR